MGSAESEVMTACMSVRLANCELGRVRLDKEWDGSRLDGLILDAADLG